MPAVTAGLMGAGVAMSAIGTGISASQGGPKGRNPQTKGQMDVIKGLGDVFGGGSYGALGPEGSFMQQMNEIRGKADKVRASRMGPRGGAATSPPVGPARTV